MKWQLLRALTGYGARRLWPLHDLELRRLNRLVRTHAGILVVQTHLIQTRGLAGSLQRLHADLLRKRKFFVFSRSHRAAPPLQSSSCPALPCPLLIEIDLTRQRLRLRDATRVLREYDVSTGANGIGEINGSGCTPRGRHIVRAKIGAGSAQNAVFVQRRATGEIWSRELHEKFPQRDWILTRILWLSGIEVGRNRLGCVDTFRRYIYLHGTPPVTRLGAPGSKGCVRMRNEDIIELFELIPAGIEVKLHE